MEWYKVWMCHNLNRRLTRRRTLRELGDATCSGGLSKKVPASLSSGVASPASVHSGRRRQFESKANRDVRTRKYTCPVAAVTGVACRVSRQTEAGHGAMGRPWTCFLTARRRRQSLYDPALLWGGGGGGGEEDRVMDGNNHGLFAWR